LVHAGAIRAGELIEAIEPQQGERTDLGTPTTPSRKEPARDAGLSECQQKQAQRVARVPADEISRQADRRQCDSP